jgi:polysaccharide export outer membrane protein
MRRPITASTSLLTALVFSSAMVGCGPSFAKPPTYPHEDPAFTGTDIVPPGVDNDPPAPLALLPGDVVTVRSVSNEVAEYAGLVVDSEGKVHVPGVGGVSVAGLPPHQAERTIEGMLQKQDRFVRANVLVTAWAGHYATVIGAVGQEGPKTVTPGMRLAELLSAAGGLQRSQSNSTGQPTALADLDGARLRRAGKEVPVSVRLALTGDPRHNVFVHAGDQLFVPAGLGNRVAVLGIATINSTLQPYHPGMRLTEALAGSGALTIDADDEDVRVIRGPLKRPLVYQFDLDALVSGRTGDVELAPGDVIYVSRHWSATMGEVIMRVAPLIALTLSAAATWAIVDRRNNQ